MAILNRKVRKIFIFKYLMRLFANICFLSLLANIYFTLSHKGKYCFIKVCSMQSHVYQNIIWFQYCLTYSLDECAVQNDQGCQRFQWSHAVTVLLLILSVWVRVLQTICSFVCLEVRISPLADQTCLRLFV